jgi:hypothetical protein
MIFIKCKKLLLCRCIKIGDQFRVYNGDEIVVKDHPPKYIFSINRIFQSSISFNCGPKCKLGIGGEKDPKFVGINIDNYIIIHLPIYLVLPDKDVSLCYLCRIINLLP